MSVKKPVREKTGTNELERRLDRLEIKITLILWLAATLIGAAGTAFWKMWDIGRDVSSLTVKVDLHDKEDVLKIISSINTNGDSNGLSTELRQAFEKIVRDIIDKQSAGYSIPHALYYELGMISAHNGSYERAIEYFKKATEGEQPDYRAFSSLGASYLFLANKEADKNKQVIYATMAKDPLTRAIYINPSHGRAHLNLGIAYSIMNQDPDALNEWETAIKIGSDLDGVYYNRACYYGSKKENAKALADLELAVQHGFAGIDDLHHDEERFFRDLLVQKKYQELKGRIRQQSNKKVVK